MYPAMRLNCLRQLAHGRGPTPATTKKGLVRRLDKHDRQPTPYANSTDEELWLFTAQRQTATETLADKERNRLVDILETADVEALFPDFLGLSAELRNRIYEYALSSSPALERPEQPGLTRANKQLRSESLGIFYSVNIFVLTLLEPRFSSDQPPISLQLSIASEAWLQALGEERLGLVQSLAIRPQRSSNLINVSRVGSDESVDDGSLFRYLGL